MSGVRGDFRALSELITKLGRASTEVRDGCAAAFAEEIRTRVTDDFSAARAPDGSSWRPLSPRTIARRRKGSTRPLLDTGRLRNSIHVTHDASGVYVQTSVVYAATHNFGRDAIPARPFIPSDPLPESWQRALEETAEDLMEHVLK